MTRVSPVTNAGQTISRSQEQPDPDNRDAGNGCRLWRPMQNLSEDNLHSIYLEERPSCTNYPGMIIRER